MDKREEVTKTLSSCLQKQKVVQFHNLYEESEKLAKRNVEQISSEKHSINAEGNKAKKMKIKINFMPYIPKRKRGN